ncbi:HdeD family acid-resistance protein [Hutsoniella sourekii]|uniref:HdeD family acid-resistance protein n=1 Tax=Hutsoniella sourekii TaxID=87650 RepID=UPI0004897D4A|nr:DUF308 domain-containing protein [Hutsoniella sourekii]
MFGRNESGFNWGSFLLGIFYIIIAVMAFRNLDASLFAVVAVIGVTAIIKGIFELFFRRRLKEYTGYKSTLLIVTGVIDILIGLFVLFNFTASLVALPYIFAFWLIFDAISAMVTAGPIRLVSNTRFWLVIAMAIFGLILGGWLFFHPVTGLITIAVMVGVYFLFNGIMAIISAF